MARPGAPLSPRVALLAACVLASASLAASAPASPPPAAADDAAARKAAFHAGNDGTTFLEVSAITACVPLGVLARLALDAYEGVRVEPRGGLLVSRDGRPLRPSRVYLRDFLLCVLPALPAMLAPAIAIPACAVTSLSFALFARRAVDRRARGTRVSIFGETLAPETHLPLGPPDRLGASRPFLTAYRATMTFTTAIAILAVDFPAFARRLGKCEAHGVSLMDVGAGSFVFASGVVSRRARFGGEGVFGEGESRDAMAAVRRTVRSVAPTALLAAMRTAATRATAYHVPVGEYGVDWNFFATLAAVALLADAAPVPRGRARSGAFSALAGAIVLLAHQIALAAPGGPELGRRFVLAEGERRMDSFVDRNREGLGSVPGYLGVYFLGAAAGAATERMVVAAYRRGGSTRAAKKKEEGKQKNTKSGKAGVSADEADERAAEREREHPPDASVFVSAPRRFVLWASLASLAAWALTLAAHTLVEPVCRRSANLAYATWIVAHNLTCVAAFAACAAAFPEAPPAPKLLQAANRVLLPTFLVANASTGACNLAMETNEASAAAAWGLTGAHALAVAAFAAVAGAKEGAGDERRKGVEKME